MKGRLNLLMLALFIGFNACQQSSIDEMELDTSQSSFLKGADTEWVYQEPNNYYFTFANLPINNCGYVSTIPFDNDNLLKAADVKIFNDDNFIYISILSEPDWKIREIWFNLWNENDPNKNYEYLDFPYHLEFDDVERTIFKLPYDELWETCVYLNVKLLMYKFDEFGSIIDYQYHYLEDANGWGFNHYCWQDCEDECDPFRTQTPGGWGAPANGNNPGMYRDMHFAHAFPNGLTIGGDYTLTLTSAAAVEAFLPSGGKPMPLMQDYVDPNNKMLKNSFASHLTALTLSVVFDAYDEEFSMTNDNLGDLIFAEGTGFGGMSVVEVWVEANKVFGGGSSDYSLEDLHDIISKVNEYYVDGTWTGDGTLFDDCWNYEE